MFSTACDQHGSMERRICAKCHTSQQWAMWERCTCGGKFVAEPAGGVKSGLVAPSEATKAARRARERETLRKFYSENPWIAPPAFIMATILSAIYPVPLVATFTCVVSVMLIGIVSINRQLRGDFRWNLGFWVLLWLVGQFGFNRIQHPGVGQFAAFLCWYVFAMTAPLWLYRRRALALYSPSDGS